jgi:hypothetical protein
MIPASGKFIKSLSISEDKREYTQNYPKTSQPFSHTWDKRNGGKKIPTTKKIEFFPINLEFAF